MLQNDGDIAESVFLAQWPSALIHDSKGVVYQMMKISKDKHLSIVFLGNTTHSFTEKISMYIILGKVKYE